MNTQRAFTIMIAAFSIFSLMSVVNVSFAQTVGNQVFNSQNVAKQNLLDVLPNSANSTGLSKNVTIASGVGAAGKTGPCVALHNCFDPFRIIIQPGSSVNWTNNDNVSHTITSGKVVNGTDINIPDRIFDRTIQPGKTISIQFNHTGGITNYFDTLHPWMKGQVQVVNSTSTQAGTLNGPNLGQANPSPQTNQSG
jgi:plastocyanin